MDNLIILPGWGGNKKTWQEFINFIDRNPIKEDLKVNILELPCFGGKDCPEEVWGIEEYSQFVRKYIEENIDTEGKVYLLGHSFGGAVAARLTYNEKNLVNKLILTAPAIIRPKNKFKRFFFGMIAKIGKYVFKIPFIEKFDIWAKKMLYKFINSDYNETSGIKRDIYKKIIRNDQRNILPYIKTETLVIWGKKDKLLPYKDGKEIINKLQNGKLKTISEGGHGLHLDQKQKLRNFINEFINN